MEELISDLIDEARIKKQITQVRTDLGEVRDIIIEINKLGRNSGPGFSMPENTTAIKKAKTEVDKLYDAQKRLSHSYTELAKQQAQVREETIQQNKENKFAAQQALGLVDAYKRLSIRYNEAAREAKNLLTTQGLQSEAAMEAAKRASELGDQLKKIDAAVGQYGRNVGNYASANFALSQVLRETPALAINFQTFILAISNNLPILIDEFGKLSKSIDASTGAALGSGKAFKQMLGSLFSFGNLLTIGIALFTIFAKDIAAFASSLFNTQKQLRQTEEAQRILNESMKDSSSEYQKATRTVNELEINVDLARRGLLKKDDVVKQYNESMGKTTGTVKALDEVEQQLVKNGPAYIRMQLYKAAAQLALEEAAKSSLKAAQASAKTAEETASGWDRALSRIGAAAAQEQGADVDFSGTSAKVIKERGEQRRKEAIAQAEKDQNVQEKIAKDFQEKAAKIAKDNNFNFFEPDPKKGKDAQKTAEERRKAALEALKIEFEANASQQESVFKNERLSQEKRIDALDKYMLARQGVLSLQRQIELVGEEKNNAEIAKQDAAFKKGMVEEEIKYQDELLKINTDAFTKKLEKIKQDHDKEKTSIEAAQNAELANVARLREEGLLDDEQTALERLRIDNKYKILQLKNEVKTQEAILEIRHAAGEDVSEQLNNLAGLQEQISKLEIEFTLQSEKLKTAAFKKASAERLKIAKDEQQKIKEQIIKTIQGVQDFAAYGLDIVSAQYEKQSQDLEQRSKQLDEYSKKEIEAIKRSALTEEEKQRRIAIIQQDTANKEAQLERRRRLVAEQQAKFERAKAIFDVIANTAVNLVKVFPNPALMALAGAVGAAQLAAVIARPLPKYADGRDGGPAEWAIVGDGGRSEVVEYPRGGAWVTPDRPTKTFLPAGATVHKSIEDYEKAAYDSMITPLSALLSGQSGGGQVDNGSDKIVKAIKGNRPVVKVYGPTWLQSFNAAAAASGWNNYYKHQIGRK